jgi:hypothetical protein
MGNWRFRGNLLEKALCIKSKEASCTHLLNNWCWKTWQTSLSLSCLPFAAHLGWWVLPQVLICRIFLKYLVENSEAIHGLSGKDPCLIISICHWTSAMNYGRLHATFLSLLKLYDWQMCPTGLFVTLFCDLWVHSTSYLLFWLWAELLTAGVCRTPAVAPPHGNICSRVFLM